MEGHEEDIQQPQSAGLAIVILVSCTLGGGIGAAVGGALIHGQRSASVGGAAVGAFCAAALGAIIGQRFLGRRFLLQIVGPVGLGPALGAAAGGLVGAIAGGFRG